MTPQTSTTKLTPGHSNPGETKTMEVTTPELGPVRFWSPKSSSFSGRDSIVVEEAAKKLTKSTAECKQVRRSEFFYSA